MPIGLDYGGCPTLYLKVFLGRVRSHIVSIHSSGGSPYCGSFYRFFGLISSDPA